MREAISMVQMILYRELLNDLETRTTVLPPEQKTLLAGAVVNNLFGTEPSDPSVVAFAREHRTLVEQELWQLSRCLDSLRPWLTDALRMKAICDNQEGIHSIPSLLMAKALGILQEERALPMPSTFMLSVRTLAVEHGLVERMEQHPPQTDCND